MTKTSITTRITTWYTMFLVVISVILMVVLYRYYDFREMSTAENQIIRIVEDVSDLISTNGREYALEGDIDYYSEATYISVYDEEGAFFAGRIPENSGELPEIKLDSTQTFDDAHGRQWYVHDTEIYMREGSNLVIRGVMENSGYELTYRRMGRFFIFMIPGLIIVAVAGGIFISRRALGPVRELISVVNEIQDDGDLSRRAPVPDSEDETSELATSINGLFDKIETVVNRERQFTSDVSHELRTPLTIIRTQSEYAMEDQGYVQQALRIINSESHRMSNLITSLLTISRSESGRLHPEMKAVDVKEALSDLAEQVKIAASETNADIVFIDETDGSDLIIESDEELLMRIALNLLENAVRYGKNPDGRIEIRVRDEGENAVITVADDGEGIAAKDQNKVWDRFYRTETSRSRRDSTGLGLAMVDSLTKALGGSIRIVPDEEKRPEELPGAVFELTLPKNTR